MTSIQRAVAYIHNQIASNYDAAAILAQEVGQETIERLSLIKINPKTILDLGAGTGYFNTALKQRYPDAELICLDLSEQMLRQQSGMEPMNICADGYQLPLKDYSIDFIFSNLMLPWCFDIKALLVEVRRILSPNGLFMFTTIGPETFREFRLCLPKEQTIPNWLDMHEIGDALLALGFVDPVMDMATLTLRYRKFSKLLREMQQQGIDNIFTEKELLPIKAYRNLKKNYSELRDEESYYPITFEIVNGHAWGRELQQAGTEKNNTEVVIPISSITRR